MILHQFIANHLFKSAHMRGHSEYQMRIMLAQVGQRGDTRPS